MYVVGGPDTTPDYVVKDCDGVSPKGFMCTLDAAKHPDVHAAGTGFDIADVWPVNTQ